VVDDGIACEEGDEGEREADEGDDVQQTATADLA